MNDIRKEKTLASQLDIGMFVCELDRPWLGTPFLLEGVLIENTEQIATIRSLCEYVFVDRTFSTGDYYLTPTQHTVSISHKTSPADHRQYIYADQKSNSNTKTNKTQPTNKNFSFFEVIKEIQASNQVPDTVASASGESDNVLFNMRSIGNNPEKSAHPSTHNDALSSLTTQIKADFTNFVSGLKYWKRKKNESQLKTKSTSSEIDQARAFSHSIIKEIPLVEEEIAEIYPVFEQSQIATREIFEALAENQKIDLTKVDDALNGMVESIERNPDALLWLAQLKLTDNYSYNHALIVSITLMALANFMSLQKKQVKDLGLAGLLQDIGKAKIPSELLLKEEKITEAEFELLKKHVDYALELLEVTDNISGTVILAVSQHHERIDGSGYPFQLTGKKISLIGQMAGLVDTYCALTSSKVYAKGVYNQIALEKIHALRDTKFSGTLIDQLVQFMGMYPVSSLVELNSGEVAVVIQQNSVRRLLPRVLAILNPDKTKNEYPATIDLITAPLTPTGEPYQIVRGLPPDSYGLNISNYFS